MHATISLALRYEEKETQSSTKYVVDGETVQIGFVHVNFS